MNNFTHLETTTHKDGSSLHKFGNVSFVTNSYNIIMWMENWAHLNKLEAIGLVTHKTYPGDCYSHTEHKLIERK